MEIVLSSDYVTHAIANHDVHVVVFLVGSANNASQQYPAWIDNLKEKGNILVVNIDPELEEPPLFSAILDHPIHVKNDAFEEHIVPQIRFLSFRTILDLNDDKAFAVLKKHVEMCMDRNILFIYSSFTGIDSFVLQERMHSVYGDDERFNRLCDFGSLIGPNMRSTCMMSPNDSPPIFSPDMTRIWAIDTVPLPELIVLRDTYPDNEWLHKRIKFVIDRKIRHCLDTDCVLLRNYVVGDVARVLPHILKDFDFSGELSLIPFNMVRDYLLTFCIFIADDNVRTMYEYCVRDLVNMSKENRYQWFTIIKNILNMY